MQTPLPPSSPAGEAGFVAGDEASFTLPAFRCESGQTLQDLRIGYVTHGRLNAARDNAILLFPGTANTRHAADGHIGPGRAFDPEHDFIIATDAIGAGTSSQPADGLGADFPRYSIRDMVHAQQALVTQGLGLARLKAVAGASMGAFQALEWSIHHPELARAVVLMVPAARAGAVFRTAVDAAIAVLMLDPQWEGPRYARPPLDGLRAAGRLYYPWTVTDAWLEQLAPEALARELQGTIDRAAGWDAWNFIRRYQASASHDVAQPFGGDLAAALSRVRSRMLVLPSATDRLLPLASARDIAAHVAGAVYAEIPSPRGHLGWRAMPGTPETTFITRSITRFLNDKG